MTSRSAQMKRIGDLVDVLGGGTPSKKEPSYWTGSIPWVSPKDMKRWDIHDALDHVSSAAVTETAAKLVDPPAVLIVVRGMILAHSLPVAISRVPLAINQDLKALVPKNGVDTEYLAFMIAGGAQALLARVEIAGHGTRRLPTDAWASFEIRVPALPEQKRVVARVQQCIEKIDELNALRTEALTESEALLGVLIEELLPSKGREVSLADVCSIESNLVDPREKRFAPMLHIGGANIESGTGRLVDVKTAAEEELTSGKFEFSEDDVLYNKIRPYLRKVARPTFSGLCSADMYPLRPKAGTIERSYLFFLLLSRSFTEYAIRASNRAGMPKVNRADLFAYRFALPSLSEQRAAALKLDEACSASVSLWSEFKGLAPSGRVMAQAVLRKAFAGEL